MEATFISKFMTESIVSTDNTVSNDTHGVEIKTGISPDFLLKTLKKAEGKIFNIIKRKIFISDDKKRNWVNRYYGGSRGLYREIIQNLSLKLLSRIDNISSEDLPKAIYSELKHQLYVSINNQRSEICESEFGMKFTSLLEMIPDVEYDDQSEVQNEIHIDLDGAPLTINERKVLKYHYIEELDYDAICQKLNLKTNYARHIRSSAIDKLRLKYINVNATLQT